MPFKSQIKLIVSIFIVLLLIPILLYFFSDDVIRQFIIDFSGYFGAVISITGIYLIMMMYLNHKEFLEDEENKRQTRGYFQVEKVKLPADFKHLSFNKSSKLLATENFKRYGTHEELDFYLLNLVSEAKIILNLEINFAYKDLSFIDTLYIARVDAQTELYIPKRLSQSVDMTLEHVELKTIELKYETLAGEKMRLVYEEDYKKMNTFGEDQAGHEVKLSTEYFNEIELRSL